MQLISKEMLCAFLYQSMWETGRVNSQAERYQLLAFVTNTVMGLLSQIPDGKEPSNPVCIQFIIIAVVLFCFYRFSH